MARRSKRKTEPVDLVNLPVILSGNEGATSTEDIKVDSPGDIIRHLRELVCDPSVSPETRRKTLKDIADLRGFKAADTDFTRMTDEELRLVFDEFIVPALQEYAADAPDS